MTQLRLWQENGILTDVHRQRAIGSSLRSPETPMLIKAFDSCVSERRGAIDPGWADGRVMIVHRDCTEDVPARTCVMSNAERPA